MPFYCNPEQFVNLAASIFFGLVLLTWCVAVVVQIFFKFKTFVQRFL